MADSTTPRNSDNLQQPQQHLHTANPEWIEKAHQLTRSIVSNWIRSVFQETCVLILKEQLVAHNHPRVLRQQQQNTTEIEKDKEENSAVTTNLVVVTPQDLEACVHACRRLGQIWCQKLRQRGIYDVSRWLEKIMATDGFLERIMGDDSLIMDNDSDNDDDRSEEDDDHDEILETEEKDNEHKNVKEKDENENDDDDSEVMNILKKKNTGDDPTVNDDDASHVSPKDNGTTLVLTKLQRLGEEDDEDDSSDDHHNHHHQEPSDSSRHERYIRILDQMGREGSTLWPYGWDVVERAAQRNTKRIHMETISGRPKPASRVTKNYEVVLKDFETTTSSSSTLVGKRKDDDNDNDNDDDDPVSGDDNHRKDGNTTHSSEHDDDDKEETHVSQPKSPSKLEHEEEKTMMPWAVQRTYKKRKLDMNHDVEAQPLSTTTASQDAMISSRQPSLIQGEERWSWKEDVLESIPQHEKEYLEETMIRSDNEEEPSNSILGALKNVGHIHLCLEGSTRFGGLDNIPALPESSPLDTTTAMEDDGYSQQHYQKVRRDNLKQAKNERLGPFRQENKYAEYKARQGKKFSKVVRTMNAQQERHVELDLGECLLRIKSSVSGRRMTCAFSSLEVSLEDATGL